MSTHDERKTLKNEPLPDDYPNNELFADIEKQHLDDYIPKVQPCLGQMPCPSDTSENAITENLPSMLLSMDEQIEAVEARLIRMRRQREEMLQKALKSGCITDSGAMIIPKEKNLPRRINMDEFKRLQPGLFALAQSTQRTALLEEVKRTLDRYTSKEFESEIVPVTLGLLKSLKIPENIINDVCYPHEIRTTYEVVRITRSTTKPTTKQISTSDK